jgi:quinol monooxygenase YgiN
MTMNKHDLLTGALGAATLIVGIAAGPAFAQTATAPAPVLAVISHPVKDYAAWRVVYESAEPIRQKAGVTGAEVFRDPKEPNKIVIIHRFKTIADAQAFLADPDLKAAMSKGGVTAPPTAIIAVAP